MIATLSHSEVDIQTFMDHFRHACKAFGLEIGFDKSGPHDSAPNQPYIEPFCRVQKVEGFHSCLAQQHSLRSL